MDTFTKIWLASLSFLTVIGAIYAFAPRKFIVGPNNDDLLRKIRKCGIAMFILGAITVISLILYYQFRKNV